MYLLLLQPQCHWLLKLSEPQLREGGRDRGRERGIEGWREGGSDEERERERERERARERGRGIVGKGDDQPKGNL